MAIQLSVSTSKVQITNLATLKINQGEYGVNECEFTFAEEFNNLEKRAIFTSALGKSYLVEIENDTCEIPAEALALAGNIKIGVYAYELDNEEKLILRYSPTYATFTILEGSYIQNVELSNQTMKDLFSQLDNLQNQINGINNQINDMNSEIGSITGAINNINANLTTINNTLNELNSKSIIVAE